MSIKETSITRAEINAWLEKTGLSRQWLADKLGLSITSINSNLAVNSKRSFPAPTLKLIKQLMEQEDSNPSFTLAEYALLQERAEKNNMSVEDYIKARLFEPEKLK